MRDASGEWIGWGLGPPPDVSPKVSRFKERLRRKFGARASGLDSSEVYTEDLAHVVADTQRIWGFPATGMIDYKFQVRAGWIVPAPALKPMLYTVHGTGQPNPTGPGLPWDTAWSVRDRYELQPIGNYPAKPFPMWPSIMAGLDELCLQTGRADRAGREINVAGYSQGAIVVGLWLKHHVLDPAGSLHHLMPFVNKVVLWGNPMRQAGIVTPDNWLPAAERDTKSAGILEDRLVGFVQDGPYAHYINNAGTHITLADYAHRDDMYANCYFTKEGENERAICKIIMGNNVFGGPDSILMQLYELVRPGNTLTGIMGIYRAVLDAGSFFGSGTRAHGYNIGPAIEFLRS